MVITLWSGAIANVSWVQYVVLAKNLFLVTLSLSAIQVDLPYVSVTRATFLAHSLSFNSMFSAKLMPWYTFLIVFRVLSISLVIVALPPTIWIPIYALLLLGIIFIGYWKTKRDWDFIARGLKSAFTSGLDQMDFNTY